jgi:hypothetical protein
MGVLVCTRGGGGAGVCVVKWPVEKKTDANPIYCIVTVFGVAY